MSLLAGRPKSDSCGASLDHAEIARDAVRTHVEWIRFPRFAVCSGVSFEVRIVEFGVIRHQGSRTVVSGGLRHLLGGSDIAVVVCGTAVKRDSCPAYVCDAK